MAEATSISTTGELDRDTKNSRRFNTAWGVIYIPLTQLAKIGNPENVKFIVEPVDND